MSKVGKKPIEIPSDVTITVNGDSVLFKGPKGEISLSIKKPILVQIADQKIALQIDGKDDMSSKQLRQASRLWGLERSLVANSIKGVRDGFQKVLEFEGVGYRASVKGSDLELNLGYSHPITVKALDGIAFKTEKNTITVMGLNRETVGQVAAEIRSHRLPEPYRGSGIRYQGEVIIKKAGKKAASGA